jgi:hypothetical protein
MPERPQSSLRYVSWLQRERLGDAQLRLRQQAGKGGVRRGLDSGRPGLGGAFEPTHGFRAAPFLEQSGRPV